MFHELVCICENKNSENVSVSRSENEARYVVAKTKMAKMSRSQPFHDFMK